MTLTAKVMEYRRKLASRHPTASMTAEEIIAEALKYKVYVAWSGGRCSTVALHLTLQQDPDILVMFNNTGVEYPETVKYVHRMAKEWRLNFNEVKPDTTFWKLVEEHGFPQLRGSGKAGRPRKPACCEYLKEKPANNYVKEHGMDGFISGIRVEESRPRALGIFQTGVYYKAQRDGLWKFHPIALWSIEKLIQYAKLHHLPLNPLYDMGLPRVGCMPCTGFTQWREQLSLTRPRFYKWLNREYQKSVGEPTLWEFEDRYDVCVEDLET